MTDATSGTVWMDGEFVPSDEAQVHVLTHSLHYGFGVFEGTRFYEQLGGGTAVFRLEDHLRRLEQSAHILLLEMPYSRDELRRASLELVRRSGLSSGYLRHLVYLGHGAMGLYPSDNPVKVAIAAWPWGAYLGEEGLERGVRCKISSYTRPAPNSTMTKAKAIGNYVNSILAKREAKALGYDEGLLLDNTGCLSEGSGENLFMVRKGQIKTPPLVSVLEGITRESVIHLARLEGWDVREAPITRDELYTAEEVFMTGTAAEITPVREVDDRRIGTGRPGEITKTIQERFFSAVQGAIPELDGWLAPVASRRSGSVDSKRVETGQSASAH